MSPQRMFPTTPLIKLGDNHFSKVSNLLLTFEFLRYISPRYIIEFLLHINFIFDI
jgi:hypothetical protein